MTREELALQRRGYAAAFRSRDVIDAIAYGRHGRVAITYVEWGASNSRRVIVPWMLVAGASDALALAARLDEAKIGHLFQTSIAGAIRYGLRALGDNAYTGERRVIDISGDGPNNDGGTVTVSRDMAVREGVTINGLPVVLGEGAPEGGVTLDAYYADCVVGGPRSFILPVSSWSQFPTAVRLKLALELSGRAPRLWYADAGPMPRFRGISQTRTDCGIGEKLWRGMEPG